jgi:hypothetical protein
MIRSIKSIEVAVPTGDPTAVTVTEGLTYIVAVGGTPTNISIQAVWHDGVATRKAPLATAAVPGVYTLNMPSSTLEITATGATAYLRLHTNPVTTINVGSSTYA